MANILKKPLSDKLFFALGLCYVVGEQEMRYFIMRECVDAGIVGVEYT